MQLKGKILVSDKLLDVIKKSKSTNKHDFRNKLLNK